jgi:hypothetical protein
MIEENTKEQTIILTTYEDTLRIVRDRSFSGRHPELGRMINCQICGLRHRQNERKCEQKFAEKDGVVYGELKPPVGLVNLTTKQILGAKMFKGRRVRPRHRPTKPLTRDQRILKAAAERKKNEQNIATL